MAGFGGQPKISVTQQSDTLHTLLPALITGERLLVRQEDQDDDTVTALLAQLRECLAEMRMLIMETEDGHSRLSALDPDELEFHVEHLTREADTLITKIRDAVALAKRRGR